MTFTVLEYLVRLTIPKLGKVNGVELIVNTEPDSLFMENDLEEYVDEEEYDPEEAGFMMGNEMAIDERWFADDDQDL